MIVHMHVTDLPLNQAMGMRLDVAGEKHLIEMPETPLLLNHLRTVHASVQFALAEACSGELLLKTLGAAQEKVFAVLRTSSVKFRKPARGLLRASASLSEDLESLLIDKITLRGRMLVSVEVEVLDTQNIVTMTGQFDWLLQLMSGEEGSQGG